MTASHFKNSLLRFSHRTGLLRLTMSLQEPRGLKPGNRPFQILIYHRVADGGDAYVPATSVAAFDHHMRCLRRYFHPMRLTDLLAAAERHEVPPRAVAVTFDDGYADVFVHALPIMQRYRVPVIVYVATGHIDEARPMWNDRVGQAIRDTRRTEMTPLHDLPPLPLRGETQRHTALRRTLEALKRRPPQERDALTTELARSLEVPTDHTPRMLSWEQVAAMHAAGVELGAHTVHHPILSTLSAAEATEEIVASKRAIEERLQVPVHHFAYPNGTAEDFDATTKRLVQQAGFTSAVSTIFGINTAATDRYALRRGGPWEEDEAVFAAKLWWYRWGDGTSARPAT